jgi:hypothetical protein
MTSRVMFSGWAGAIDGVDVSVAVVRNLRFDVAAGFLQKALFCPEKTQGQHKVIARYTLQFSVRRHSERGDERVPRGQACQLGGIHKTVPDMPIVL